VAVTGDKRLPRWGHVRFENSMENFYSDRGRIFKFDTASRELSRYRLSPGVYRRGISLYRVIEVETSGLLIDEK